MTEIKIYEINADYVDYLAPFAPHLFRNSKKGQANTRKYIGIVLHINGYDYFAPLSSFKPKHEKMREGLDFLKVKDYAVINLNNMFPVPPSECAYVDFNKVKDSAYKSLLLAEYRFIKSISAKICKNAAALYAHGWQRENLRRLPNAATILRCWNRNVRSINKKNASQLGTHFFIFRSIAACRSR